ncbi:hypothetical protein L204_103614 [Cryptococcus depauperatus]|nr:hypothetical protein L204_01931 [Cryptococcus depauperatus CBS 7855]
MGLGSQADSHSAIQNGGGSPEALNLLEKTLIPIKPSSRLSTSTPTDRPSSPEKPNTILPAEIWKKIISYVVDSPSTLCALALTCRAMSSLSLPLLWYRVSVGLKHRRCPMRSSYIDATTTQTTASGLIKPPALPLLTAELRSRTRIMDFYFERFKWSLNIFEKQHRYGLKVYRMNGGKNVKSIHYYTQEAAVIKITMRIAYHLAKKWFTWAHLIMTATIIVVVLKDDSHHIDFNVDSMTRCASSLCEIRDLHDIVVIFYQGKDQHKHLSKIMDTSWRIIRRDLVYFLKKARKRHPRTRITLVNIGCFEARWLGFSEPVKEQLVQQKVKEELKTEGLSRWEMELFERFPEHVAHSDGNEDVDKTESLELNAGKEKERLLSMSEYLQTEDWEGELEESEVKQWLDESS